MGPGKADDINLGRIGRRRTFVRREEILSAKCGEFLTQRRSKYQLAMLRRLAPKVLALGGFLV